MNYKRYPEDEQDYGYIGIKFPTNGSSAGSSGGFFNMSQTTEEQAVSNYINLLLTKRGERYMQPEFGVGIQYKLFEPNTLENRTDIEFEIRRQSALWLPYITNHSIEVRERAELAGLAADPENAFHIVITFSVTEAGANKQITLFQNSGRVDYIVS